MAFVERLPLLVTPCLLAKAMASSSFKKHNRVVEADLSNRNTSSVERYMKSHIDDAVYLDVSDCAEKKPTFPWDLPDRHCFADLVGQLGISNRHHLIIYDRSPFGFLASSRIWWTFRLFGHENVSILNGGLGAWEAQQLPLSDKPVKLEKETFVIKENEALLRDFGSIQRNLQVTTEHVLDSRTPDEFSKPNSSLPNGMNHIPMSKNVPYAELFDLEKRTLKSDDDLQKLFAARDVNLTKPLVTSCMAGVTATTLALAFHQLGKTDVSVYLVTLKKLFATVLIYLFIVFLNIKLGLME